MFEFSDTKEGSRENISSGCPLIQPCKKEEDLIIEDMDSFPQI